MEEHKETPANETYALLTKLRAKGFPDAMSEEAVKIAVIIPILNALGWDSSDSDEVIPEYAVKSGKADFALVHKAKPRILIEAKAPALILSGNHRDQLTSYAYHVGAGIAILTNGRLWEFYVPFAPGDWKQRMACRIDILKQDPSDAAQEFVRILSKSCVASNKAQLYANEVLNAMQRKEEIVEALPGAWRNIFLEPGDHLISLLTKAIQEHCDHEPTREEVIGFLAAAAAKAEVLTPREHKPRSPIPVEIPKQPDPNSRPASDPSLIATPLQRNHIVRPPDLTGKKPYSITLFGEEQPINSWRQIWLVVVREIARRHEQEFKTRFQMARGGRWWWYLNEDKAKVQEAVCLENVGCYTSGCMSADSSWRLSHELLEIFGHSADDLQIQYK